VGIREVENSLFKLPRFVLSLNPETFESMYMLPILGDEAVDGSSDTRPLVLAGISSNDLRQLLKVLLPLCVYSR
jgi:hypothetical protein